MKAQRGAAMVEFALIALLFFMLLFGIIEFGRAFFTYNTLVEATRRGARVAAVCPVSAGGITQVKQVTIFDTPGGTSTPLLGLTENDIQVSYWTIDSTGTLVEIASPFPSVADSNTYDKTQLVRVEILPSFTHTLFIPLLQNTFSVPSIQTTLPSESLGRVTDDNPVTKRCCPGDGYSGTLCTP
ncbi:MAG: TadE/TadG family type IV pilus assembly protein [Methylococcaceae bacterium]